MEKRSYRELEQEALGAVLQGEYGRAAEVLERIVWRLARLGEERLAKFGYMDLFLSSWRKLLGVWGCLGREEDLFGVEEDRLPNKISREMLRLYQGAWFWRQGDLDRAIEWLRSHVDEGAIRDPFVAVTVGQWLLWTGRAEDALGWLNEADLDRLLEGRGDHFAEVRLSCLLALDRVEDALEEWRLLRASSSYSDVVDRLYAWAFEQGREDVVRRLIREDDERSILARWARGMLAWLEGDLKEARRVWRDLPRRVKAGYVLVESQCVFDAALRLGEPVEVPEEEAEVRVEVWGYIGVVTGVLNGEREEAEKILAVWRNAIAALWPNERMVVEQLWRLWRLAREIDLPPEIRDHIERVQALGA